MQRTNEKWSVSLKSKARAAKIGEAGPKIFSLLGSDFFSFPLVSVQQIFVL